MNDDQTGYVTIAGRQYWHEISGHGEPAVLLHGAFGGAASWFQQTPALVGAGYRVFQPERRGHAHTPDIPGPLTYSVMADDTIDYLDAVMTGPAHLIGWSDGAVVAVLVALRRPELVARLVLIGQYYNSAGKVIGGLGDSLASGADGPVIQFLRTEYDRVSPDGPDHFPVVYAKTLAMLTTEPELDLSEFAAITAPTLVLQGDRDEVTLEHSVAVVDALPNARLAVIPGSHSVPIENPAAVNALVVAFLQGAPQEFDFGD